MKTWKYRIPATGFVALVAIAVVASAQAVSPTKTGRAAATVRISIPRSLKGSPPVVLQVPVQKPGTLLGIDTPLHADPGQAAMDNANQRIASLVGAKSIIQDANLDANKQVQIGDGMLAQGVNAITTDVLFPHSLDAFYKRAAAKKVPVCVEFSTLPGGAQEDDTQAGREMAAYLHQLFPNGATGAVLANTPAAVILNREKGFYTALKSYPNLKIIVKQRNLKEVVAEARTMAENMLQAHPDIQFFWTTNDNEALGAGLAAKRLGKHPVILGMNGTPEAVDAVKRGLITATWDSNQNLMGSIVAINCFKAITAGGTRPPAMLVQFTKITKSNAAKWIPWPQRPKLTVIVK
jgi:ribose transport system substrate-binding protein